MCKLERVTCRNSPSLVHNEAARTLRKPWRSSEGIAGFSLVFVSVEISHSCTVGFKHHLRRASSRVTSSFVNNQLPSSMSGSNESELDLAWTKGLFHHTYLNYGASACQGWTLSRQAVVEAFAVGALGCC